MAEYSAAFTPQRGTPPLVVIAGPTASGKTALALALARQFFGEIVSADSMQVYRGMEIQTAQPTESERGEIAHHLVGVLEPSSSFSVAQYRALAVRAIDDITARGRLPLLAGGTGLYISAVADNIQFGEMEVAPSIRPRLTRQAQELGGEAMLARLRECDPKLAARLHPNNLGRIIRALEVFEATGRTLSEFQAQSRLEPPRYNALLLGVDYRDREHLYRRIDERVDEMLQNGLLAEVGRLREQKLSHTAAQAIGCKELFGYFDGLMTLEQATEHLKRQTRRYAKRQLTWFRRDQRIHWLYREDDDFVSRAQELVSRHLSGACEEGG